MAALISKNRFVHAQPGFEEAKGMATMISDAKRVWEAGLSDELCHWKHWLDKGESGADHSGFNDFAWRMDPGADLSVLPHLANAVRPLAAQAKVIRILDVGAGPLTFLGKKFDGLPLEITAVDPLAAEYDALLSRSGIVPLVRTQYGRVESLSEQFAEASFDLVYCQNALDHVYDPIHGIREMVRVVKPGRSVLMLHFINEGESEGYQGLHQWNFCRQGDEFVIWGHGERFSANELLADSASVLYPAFTFPGYTDRMLLVALSRRMG